MKILVCSPGFLPANTFGGPPYTAFNLCRALIRAGAEVRVVTTDRNGPTKLNVETDCWTTFKGVPVWYARTADDPFLYASSAAKVIAQSTDAVDCVINSGTLWSHSGWLAWRATRRYRKPSLTYVHGLLSPWAFDFKPMRKRILWHLWGKRILRDSSIIVALSESEKQSILRRGVRTRVEVVPNGASTDTGVRILERAALDATFPALAGRRYVLFLGRIHAVKGLDLLLPAIAELRRHIPDTVFVLAGPVEPGYAAQFAKLLSENDVDEQLVLAGPVDGEIKETLLEHAEVFVLPSYSEGLPVAALEALAHGCPVVLTRHCNLPEVKTAGAGIEINSDPGELVAALRQILSDGNVRRELASNARKVAREHFDWDAIGKRTLALCNEALS